MKKLLLATAIASASISSLQASTTYTLRSDIQDVNLWIGSVNASATPLSFSSGAGRFTDVNVGGQLVDDNDDGIPESGTMTFTGVVIFNSGPDVRLTFDLQGSYAAGSGATMNTGTIEIDTNTGNGFSNYDTVDASATNIPFVAGLRGHIAPAPLQTLSGIIVDPITMPGEEVVTSAPLPGLWNGVFADPTWNRAVSAITLFGNSAGLFLEGEVTRAPVPIPAAAWLFGSALMGLWGIRYKRRSSK